MEHTDDIMNDITGLFGQFVAVNDNTELLDSYLILIENKVKVPNFISRLYKILNPYDNDIYNGDNAFMTTAVLDVFPGVNISTYYNNINISDDDREVIFKIIRKIKMRCNLYKGKYIGRSMDKLIELLSHDNTDVIDACSSIKQALIDGGASDDVGSLIDALQEEMMKVDSSEGFQITDMMTLAGKVCEKFKIDELLSGGNGAILINSIIKYASDVVNKNPEMMEEVPFLAEMMNSLKNGVPITDPSQILESNIPNVEDHNQ